MNEQKKEAAAQWWAECNKRIYDFPEKPARSIFEQGFEAGQAAQQSEPSTNAVPDAWRELMQEFVDAMVDYQMDVEESPPFKHRDMMDRARDLLATDSHDRKTNVCHCYESRLAAESDGTRCYDCPNVFQKEESSTEIPVKEESLVRGFQSRVEPWLIECFGEAVANDSQERSHRFLEEALELVQATGCTEDEAVALVKYVYGRPVGEPSQEVGGAMVTLAALCQANGLDMHQAGETELARVWTKIPQIQAKQASKPAMSPLPGVYPDRQPIDSEGGHHD